MLWMFVECLPSVGGNIRVYSADDVIRDLDTRRNLSSGYRKARLRQTVKVKSDIVRK